MTGIFCSCQNDLATVDEITQENEGAFQTITNGEFLFWEGNRLKNKMEAGLLKQYAGTDQRVEIDSILKLHFYDQNKHEQALLTSKMGLFIEKDGYMEARDSVVFVNDKGEKLLTELLIWEQDSATVYTNQPITVYRSDGVIFGDGLIANENFSQYQIINPRGEIYVQSDTLRNEP